MKRIQFFPDVENPVTFLEKAVRGLNIVTTWYLLLFAYFLVVAVPMIIVFGLFKFSIK